MTDITLDGREALLSMSSNRGSPKMAQVIAFPRPIDRPALDGSGSGQAALLPRFDGAVAELLASKDLWQVRIDELLRRLDALGSFIDSLHESDAKRALRESHAAIRRALILTSEGLRLQFEILSDLPANAARNSIKVGEPTTGLRSIRSAITSWFETRIWPF
ncbi:MAG: hypothetical protein HXX15_02030 [Rhodopseudomonas sp.]|uniref:hypothetical protein n=1 Tax=Rhodopseudomonas sp. TaxID=1078 RepID=UPI0018280F9C|nr:hypothetical protein [Rhodopseudomonas sp.]NVN84843.1 hypothetical protein [Rhodopseudomonas sp.]